MPWFYIDDAFADSKPVMRLDSAIRNEAIGLWVRCGAWSAKEETDGHVPLDVVRSFGGTPKVIRALIDVARLWAPGGDFDENSTEFPPDSWRKTNEILFKNWGKWQKTRAEILARRLAEAEKKRGQRNKGRNAVASLNGKVSPRDTAGDSPGESPRDNGAVSPRDTPGESSRARARRPDPTRPLVETLGGEGNVSSDPAPPPPPPQNGHAEPPPRVCPEHWPDGTKAPCPDCMGFRKRAEAWEAEHADRLAADRRAELHAAAEHALHAIADCTLCNEDGYRGTVVCDHIDHSGANARGRELVRAALAGNPPPPGNDEEGPDW